MDSMLDKAQPRMSRRRVSWLGALPLLARHLARTMPWLTLITGCAAGTGYLALLAHIANPANPALSQGTVRLSFLPAIAALAFVLRCPFRPLIQVTPVPAWVTPAAHVLAAVPILAATCWGQLRILAHSIPRGLGHPPAVYPLIAQLVGWCAITVAVAACVDRSRYADLGGAIAAPVSFTIIAVAWYAPVSARFLVDPPATPGHLTLAWYGVTVAAVVLTGLAMRDPWHRYARIIRRLRPGGGEMPAAHQPSCDR